MFVILFKLLVLGTLVATIAVGVMARTGRVSEFYAGDAKLHPALNGLAIAASAMPAALLVSLAGVLPNGGQDDLAVFGGVLGGMLLIGLVLAAPLWRFAGYTLPDFLADRFQGGDVRTLGIIAVLFCSLPLLVAMLWVAGSVAGQAFGTDQGSAVLVVSAILLVAALPGGMRSVTITQFVLGAVLIAAVAAAVIVLRATGTVVVSPYDVGISPLPAVLAPGNSTGRLALVITLALGTASLPHLLMRSVTAASPQAARYSYAWALLFLGPLYFAPLAFRAGFALLGGGVGTSPLTSAALAALAGTALLAASLAAAFGLALTLANLLSYDVYYKSLDPTAPPQRRLGAARAGLLLVVAITAWLATRADLEIVLLATWCFSLAASVILPVLVLGLWWKRANGHGAVAGMVAGFALCLYYLLAPRYIPVSFYETSSFLSNATPDDQANYLLLKQAYALAAGPAKAAALAAWEAKALALGNWGGVPGACAALFAVPVGFLMTIVVSLLTPRPSADLQGFVAELRGPLKARD